MAKILVVDDDQDLRATLSLFFETLGFAVESAADGLTALDLLRRDPPDVLLIDLRLPQLDGWELAARVRTLFPNLPIGVLSADADKAPASVDFVLHKPASPTDIGAAVQSVLKRNIAGAQ